MGMAAAVAAEEVEVGATVEAVEGPVAATMAADQCTRHSHPQHANRMVQRPIR